MVAGPNNVILKDNTALLHNFNRYTS